MPTGRRTPDAFSPDPYICRAGFDRDRFGPPWAEMAALRNVPDIEAALRDGDGVADYEKQHAVTAAFKSGEWMALEILTSAELIDAPFDPVLMSLRALARAQQQDFNPQAIGEELDRAARIAGDRSDIVMLRGFVLSALLQARPEGTGRAE